MAQTLTRPEPGVLEDEKGEFTAAMPREDFAPQPWYGHVPAPGVTLARQRYGYQHSFWRRLFRH